jgi:hypothetical protein
MRFPLSDSKQHRDLMPQFFPSGNWAMARELSAWAACTAADQRRATCGAGNGGRNVWQILFDTSPAIGVGLQSVQWDHPPLFAAKMRKLAYCPR